MGRDEVWFGTLYGCFPLHVREELSYLRKEWGNPKNLVSHFLVTMFISWSINHRHVLLICSQSLLLNSSAASLSATIQRAR